jgi:hypothetical protein
MLAAPLDKRNIHNRCLAVVLHGAQGADKVN